MKQPLGKIDEADLIGAIRYIVGTEPDRRYVNGDGCTYRPNRRNDCGCGVGEALVYVGVDPQLLQEIDDATGRKAWRCNNVREKLQDLLTEEALNSPWVAAFQDVQDDGRTWADAERLADKAAERHGWVK